MATLGEKIKERRKKLGYTRTQLAEILDVIPNSIYRWEAGQRIPSDQDKKKLAQVLKISIAYLMGETDNPGPVNSQDFSNDNGIPETYGQSRNTKGHPYGERLKSLRRKLHLSLSDVANAINVLPKDIEKWESGLILPDIDDIRIIAEILGCSASYLAGEIDDPRPLKDVLCEGATFIRPEDYLEVPLFNKEIVACCGAGNGLYGVDLHPTETFYITKSLISVYDDLRKPFAMKTEGDSMEGIGIPDGAIVAINPADEVRTGDIALICYDDKWFIRGVIFRKDSSIELRAANPSYTPVIVDKEMTVDPEWFRIIGKVIEIDHRTRPKSII